MQEILKTVRTLDQLRELKSYLADKEFVAYDVETTGLEKGSEIIGFSVCAEASAEYSLGYYVILSYWDVDAKKMVYLETREGAKEFLDSLKSKSLLMHNGIFDCFMTETNFGVNLLPSLHTDTLMLGHLLNETRSNGLKERAVELYGEDAKKEKQEMEASIQKNGGEVTVEKYELYKADAELIAKYGAKDAILTLKLFYNDVPILLEEGLDTFFYDEESMPLLRGPTYELNTVGLKVDPEKLQSLKTTLQAECLEAAAFIKTEIHSYVAEEYPGTSKAKTFNVGSSQQLGWLLFGKLDQEFRVLTDLGRRVCKFLDMKLPYTRKAKREFIEAVNSSQGLIVPGGDFNTKTKKINKPHTIAKVWKYIATDKLTLSLYADKYQWVKKLLELKKNEKILGTYVEGIQEKMKYGIIRPSFLQHGTTSGRYSSRNPNFQNLPKNDKRVKACIVSRPGKIFVGADQAQLEPRISASISGDPRLIKCFIDKDDFYSLVGVEAFNMPSMSLKKEEPGSFADKYPKLRDTSKAIGLSGFYGTTAPKMALTAGKSVEEAQQVIDNLFEKFSGMYRFMIESHEQAKVTGKVYSLYGRPRRIPEAKKIGEQYGRFTEHSELPYAARTLLNLAVNHKIQSTAASIMNRAAIAVRKRINEYAYYGPLWKEVYIVLQVHDELVLEGPEVLKELMKTLLKDCMENAVQLPGVPLVAEPKAAYNLADLK